MVKVVITEDMKKSLNQFLEVNAKAELVTTYLLYLKKKFNIFPVAFPRGKVIYQSEQDALRRLEAEGELWRETKIKIAVGKQPVNADTKKIYICPFTGKVFGDNTHPNPQDAIYDWVSKCPENRERVDGLRVKRFYVSEDPKVIEGYCVQKKKSITKVVYSSASTGKLFHSKDSVIEDFRLNQIKPIDLMDVQSQNRFEIEPEFLAFLQRELDEDRITAFVEALVEIPEFESHVERWVEVEEEQEVAE